jgi:Xaa-Pro aminopeptidase
MSNEPGYYEQGAFGIRIESVVFVKAVATRRGFGDKKWLGFERLTTVRPLFSCSLSLSPGLSRTLLSVNAPLLRQVPIQSKMVDWALLNHVERKWLRDHNALCRKKLLPLVEGDKRAVKYLKRQ